MWFIVPSRRRCPRAARNRPHRSRSPHLGIRSGFAGLFFALVRRPRIGIRFRELRVHRLRPRLDLLRRLVVARSEEHTSELQLMRISYAVFCLKKKTKQTYVV